MTWRTNTSRDRGSERRIFSRYLARLPASMCLGGRGLLDVRVLDFLLGRVLPPRPAPLAIVRSSPDAEIRRPRREAGAAGGPLEQLAMNDDEGLLEDVVDISIVDAQPPRTRRPKRPYSRKTSDRRTLHEQVRRRGRSEGGHLELLVGGRRHRKRDGLLVARIFIKTFGRRRLRGRYRKGDLVKRVPAPFIVAMENE